MRQHNIPLAIAAPIIVMVADPLTTREQRDKIRRIMRENGFQNHGFIATSYTKYREWQDILRSAAKIRIDDHTEILRPAQRALVVGDVGALSSWATLFEAIERNVKYINRGVKRGKWNEMQIEILRFPEHIQHAERQAAAGRISEDALTHAIRRVMWGIVQHLPPDAANGLKKRFGVRPI